LDDVPPIGRDWALSPPDHEIVTGRNLWCQAVHGYLASISYCDHMVGEIVAALDASGLSERTTIILWGDNGFHLGEKLHWRKFEQHVQGLTTGPVESEMTITQLPRRHRLVFEPCRF
jgi:arylsulfatase A-like enzyme